jgi:type VI secretion system secreted protein VgrG
MKKLVIICLVCVAAISTSQAAITPLGTTAANFAVLGGSTVTNTGSTVINGDLGVSPGSAITGFFLVDSGPGIVNGTIHPGDATSQLAQNEALATYNSLTTLTGAIDLSGQDLGTVSLLTAGVYDFSSSASLTGTLTLSGPGDFVFRIVSTLGTASNAKVLLTGGADASNVYWQVGSSATLGSGTDFIGNILASANITLNGGTLDGRAMAGTEAVNIVGAETITIPEPATICLLGLGALSLIRRKKLA